MFANSRISPVVVIVGLLFSMVVSSFLKLPARDFKTWKTINLGTHKNEDALKKDLAKSGFDINALDKVIANTFIFGTKKAKVDLTVQSVADLGFKGGASYEEICARAKNIGLELCLLEVGPQLRLQYKDQPIEERLIVATEIEMNGRNGFPHLFAVRHSNGELYLDACDNGPGRIWYDKQKFVFVRKPKLVD